VQDWIKKAVLIRCPAPLPEGPATALLTRMLTPHRASAEGGENRGTSGDPRPEDKADAVFGETEALLLKGRGTEEVLHGKKRAAPEDQEGKPSKRGTMPSSGNLGRASNVAAETHDEGKSSAEL
jgi:hypothetical protein